MMSRVSAFVCNTFDDTRVVILAQVVARHRRATTPFRAVLIHY